jgi:hypothetical protein
MDLGFRGPNAVRPTLRLAKGLALGARRATLQEISHPRVSPSPRFPIPASLTPPSLPPPLPTPHPLLLTPHLSKEVSNIPTHP